MNLRILICGVLGGMLGTLALSLPLYLVLPSLYSSEWQPLIFPSSPALSVLGYLLALCLGLGTGYSCARWNWAASACAGMKCGALAGLIAGLIAFALIGAAAAGVAGTAPVYLNGPKPAGAEAQVVYLVAETVVRVGWYPYLTFWALVLAGGALGALGGWLTVCQKAEPWGAAAPAAVEEPVDASIALLVMTALTLVVCIAAISSLADNAANSAVKHDFTLSLPTRGIVDWPTGMCLFICCVATWFCGRWCSHRRGHPIRGVRRTVLIATIIMLAVPLVTIGPIMLHLKPEFYQDPVLLVGSLVWVGLAGYWACVTWRGPAELSPADAPASSSFRDRLLINAGLVGVVYPALALVTGVSQAVSLALGVVVFLSPLFDKVEPGEVLPTVAGSMQQIYAVHFLYSLYFAVVWMGWALIHAVAVLAWQAFRRRQQASQTPPIPSFEKGGEGGSPSPQPENLA